MNKNTARQHFCGIVERKNTRKLHVLKYVAIMTEQWKLIIRNRYVLYNGDKTFDVYASYVQ